MGMKVKQAKNAIKTEEESKRKVLDAIELEQKHQKEALKSAEESMIEGNAPSSVSSTLNSATPSSDTSSAMSAAEAQAK